MAGRAGDAEDHHDAEIGESICLGILILHIRYAKYVFCFIRFDRSERVFKRIKFEF